MEHWYSADWMRLVQLSCVNIFDMKHYIGSLVEIAFKCEIVKVVYTLDWIITPEPTYSRHLTSILEL